MIYYRVALLSTRASAWQWQSTALYSLHALFGVLNLYRAVPKDRVRVFFASTVLYLDEMLRRENNGLVSNSLTAALFLEEKRINSLEMARLEAELDMLPKEQEELPAPISAGLALNKENRVTPRQHQDGWRTSSPGASFLQEEWQPGGDHDTPYVFSLPVLTTQALAWARLLARVQRGELVP